MSSNQQRTIPVFNKTRHISSVSTALVDLFVNTFTPLPSSMDFCVSYNVCKQTLHIICDAVLIVSSKI